MGEPAADDGPRDVRRAFTERVKEIDPIFKQGDLERFWPALRELVAMDPERKDLSLKKSHYLAGLAARCLARNDPRSALAFLEFADAAINAQHLTPFLRGEREDFRSRARLALQTERPGAGSGNMRNGLGPR